MVSASKFEAYRNSVSQARFMFDGMPVTVLFSVEVGSLGGCGSLVWLSWPWEHVHDILITVLWGLCAAYQKLFWLQGRVCLAIS